MNWFYAYQGQRAGPVDDDGFARLVGTGTVGESTLVWHRGMSDWMPYAQARATVPGSAFPSTRPNYGPVAVGADQSQCSQCGRVFPADEVIRLEGFSVCAECKPLLLQKMRQGISPAYGAWGILPVRFGGFWIRWGALILDTLILSPLLIALWFASNRFAPYSIYSRGPHFLLAGFLQILQYAVIGFYETFFVGRFEATPGKLVCGLRIVRSDGSRITYGRAAGRYFARILTKFTLSLGYLLAVFDDQKRTLHDHVCDTRVIHKDKE